jgi:hypothetical protein
VSGFSRTFRRNQRRVVEQRVDLVGRAVIAMILAGLYAARCSELLHPGCAATARTAHGEREPKISVVTKPARRSLRFETGATMVRLNREQRMLLAETLRDIANIAAGAMVFGQFIGSQTLSYSIAAFGMGVWVALVTFAMVLAGGAQR